MPATALDPVTALVVIDLQKAIVQRATAHPAQEVVQRAAALAKAFRSCKLPVVLVTVAGTAPGRTEQARGSTSFSPEALELVPDLAAQPSDHRVVKRTWGAFTETGLERHLRSLGVTQVLLAGIATSIGVESTARQAHEAGFHVSLAVDAMTDISAEAHANSVARIFPRLGETDTSDAFLALLARRPLGQ
jgi:nicotinamidase-related amidase